MPDEKPVSHRGQGHSYGCRVRELSARHSEESWERGVSSGPRWWEPPMSRRLDLGAAPTLSGGERERTLEIALGNSVPLQSLWALGETHLFTSGGCKLLL